MNFGVQFKEMSIVKLILGHQNSARIKLNYRLIINI